MSHLKQRKELIDKIKVIENEDIIDEVLRLLEIDFDDTVYNTSPEQKTEIDNAKNQILQKRGITSILADKEIDEWLGK